MANSSLHRYHQHNSTTMRSFIVAAGYLALAHAQDAPVFTLGPASNYVKAPV